MEERAGSGRNRRAVWRRRSASGSFGCGACGASTFAQDDAFDVDLAWFHLGWRGLLAETEKRNRERAEKPGGHRGRPGCNLLV